MTPTELPDGEVRFYVNNTQISRINCLGVVKSKFVSEGNKEKRYASLDLDDGTAVIRLKAWGELEEIEKVNEGEIIEVMGRPRTYNNENYILVETINNRLTIEDEIFHRAQIFEKEVEKNGLINEEGDPKIYYFDRSKAKEMSSNNQEM